MQDAYRFLSAMVVDDSRAIRELLAAMLQDLGVGRVFEAEEGGQALRLLDREAAGIDLLFCDLAMPGMDGVQTIRALAARHLRCPVVILSGLDSRLLISVGELARTLGLRLAGLLGKPFNEAAVKAVLDQAVDARLARERHAPVMMRAEQIDQALAEGRVHVHYQPKIGLRDGRMKGVEALARIRDDNLGLIGPDSFIPVAEQDPARIARLTHAVIEQALARTAAWRRAGLKLDLAVNLSALGIDQVDLPDSLSMDVASAGLSNADVTLEVTETRAVNNAEVLDTVSRLRLQNFRLSIDDFGTGDSGLVRLRSLPFTELKIDRSFVNGASREANARAILQTSIELGRRLGMDVVAEGVENASDWTLLERLQCSVAQGFLAARPMAAELIPGFARSWNANAA